MEKAAEAGNRRDMLIVAEFYASGKGVKADADISKKWQDAANAATKK